MQRQLLDSDQEGALHAESRDLRLRCGFTLGCEPLQSELNIHVRVWTKGLTVGGKNKPKDFPAIIFGVQTSYHTF